MNESVLNFMSENNRITPELTFEKTMIGDIEAAMHLHDAVRVSLLLFLDQYPELNQVRLIVDNEMSFPSRPYHLGTDYTPHTVKSTHASWIKLPTFHDTDTSRLQKGDQNLIKFILSRLKQRGVLTNQFSDSLNG